MRRKKTILLVDGDARDRSAIRRALQQRHYQVVEAADYWEAVDVHREHQGQIDLLLTALALPGDNGYELARTLFRSDPQLKALFVSGLAGAEVSPYYHMPMTGPHLLTKPLRGSELLDRVRQVLRARIPRPKKNVASETSPELERKSQSK
jgi:DNA-binding response OmpR family regulator